MPMDHENFPTLSLCFHKFKLQMTNLVFLLFCSLQFNQRSKNCMNKAFFTHGCLFVTPTRSGTNIRMALGIRSKFMSQLSRYRDFYISLRQIAFFVIQFHRDKPRFLALTAINRDFSYFPRQIAILPFP